MATELIQKLAPRLEWRRRLMLIVGGIIALIIDAVCAIISWPQDARFQRI